MGKPDFVATTDVPRRETPHGTRPVPRMNLQ